MSDERRERVKAAMLASLDAVWVTPDQWCWELLIDTMADAAINAALPDRTAFTRLTDAWEQAILARHHDPCEQTRGECEQVLGDLEILVFGEELVGEASA